MIDTMRMEHDLAAGVGLAPRDHGDRVFDAIRRRPER
jgi:hypothetical protein